MANTIISTLNIFIGFIQLKLTDYGKEKINLKKSTEKD